MRENAPGRDDAPVAPSQNERGGSQAAGGAASRELQAHLDRIDEMFDRLNALLDAFIAAVQASNEKLERIERGYTSGGTDIH